MYVLQTHRGQEMTYGAEQGAIKSKNRPPGIFWWC